MAKRRGVRGWRARRRRTPSLAVHFPFSAMAGRTFAERSSRSSIWEMCGSSSNGFSSRARRVSSSGSWIIACKSSLGADRARCACAESSSGMSLALPQTNRHFRRGLGGLHLQCDDAGVRRKFMQAGVNCGVEEFAAADGAAGLGDGNTAVLQGEFSDDAVRQVAERRGGGGENFAGYGVTFVAELADERKNARENVVGIFHYPIEDASPFGAAEPLQHLRGEGGLRAAIFFGAHDSGERPTADVESAAFIAEPGAAAAGASGVAVSVATICGGAGTHYQNNSFAFTNSCVQGNGEIGGDGDRGFGESAFEKGGDAFGDGVAAGAADAGADASNIAGFQMVALEDDVSGITEREPGLGVSGAEGIRRAGGGARQNVRVRVHQNAVGFGAAAIKSQVEGSVRRRSFFSHSFHHA